MDNIKKQNINFWTVNVPGIDNQVDKNMAGTLDFYKKVDEVRYQHEPYLNGLFAEILKPGLVSLEVGCGLGSDLRTFSRHGLEVTGLDYSPENAYFSRLGLRACNLNGRVISGDAEGLPFPDNSFDLVYSWGCLHHTPGTKKAINELFRVLRPGGKAMVMLYHKGYQFWYILASFLLGCKWVDVDLQTYINLKYDQTPLSKMFSRRQLYRMFNHFNEVNVRVVNFGGMRFHPLLKYLWKIFQSIPRMLNILGSFAVIFAAKPGSSLPVKDQPQLCCPICCSLLDYQRDGFKCVNLTCGSQFVNYKGKIPMFHPDTFQVYQH